MARKHRIEPNAISYKYQQLQQELNELTGDNYDIEHLENEYKKAHENYLKSATKLSQIRCKSAKQLSTKVSKAMQKLGMQGGQFEVHIETDETKLSPTGIDQVTFMVSANPGQPLKPLIKVASGGELSRISLAIQMIAAQRLTLPALIFDEVDSGIGGGTAEVVGKQLRALGKNRQVLCVTHLPQVAAQAHHHYCVTKIKTKSSTVTGITIMNLEERIQETARMMGGIDITQSTLQLAHEMVVENTE